MLHDQLNKRVANTRIRDRLLLESDLTLAKATTLALQIESGLRDANVPSDATAASAPVKAIQKQPKSSRSWDKKKPPEPAPATTQPANHRYCFRCGSSNHLANKASCSPAKVTCNKCGKVGHFSCMCHLINSKGGASSSD